jgi:transcription elongation factor Elf1
MEILTKKSTDEFTCIKCNKSYKNNSGLWKHNDKFHKVECIQNCTLYHQTRDQNVYINSQD